MKSASTHRDDLDVLLQKLRPFQREGFEFATKKDGNAGRILLADEMGLGKTVTSLAVMLAYKDDWPLLILCPASLRYTWPAEIEKFYPSLSHSAVYIVKGFDDCDFYSNPVKRSRIKIVVATYSLLQNRSAASRVLQQFKFKCVIADESHNLKEKNSQRCKLAMPILLTAKRLLLLTGTPALARPVELWSQLHSLNSDLFGSYSSFTKRYCNARRGRFGWDVTGLSNADELHQKLKQIMLRRLKSDVLKDLPPKQRMIVPVKIQNAKQIKKCAEIISQLKEKRVSVNALVGDEATSAQFEARSLMMQAYQATGLAKAEPVSNYVIDWLRGSGTQKLLVFAHHTEVLDTIEAAISKHLKGIGYIRIDGSVQSAERAARVKKFQNKPQVKIALLSITASGVGLTLTAASTVIFAELFWSPGVLAQAEDRTHRIGQLNSVNIIYCVCKESELSVDMSLWSMLGRKVSNLGRMLDGDKNASLNASSVENGASENQLASFFADYSPSDPHQEITTPVKGSIQSFFIQQKTKDGSATKSKKSSKQNNPPLDESVDDSSKNDNPKVPTFFMSTKISPSTGKAKSWSCQACTFINEKRSIFSGCEMCGTISNESKQRKPLSSSVIVIDGEKSCGTSFKNGPVEQKSKPNENLWFATSAAAIHHKNNLLRFSVSQNSGRVAIFDTNGNSLFINFDIEDVINQSTGEKILEKQVKRTTLYQRETVSANDVSFDDSKVKDVTGRLLRENTKLFGTGDEGQVCFEIRSFVKSFILLREVEKKMISEYTDPIEHAKLREVLKKILLTKSTHSEIQRYAGGSKERAIDNLNNGKETERDKLILAGTCCSWCGQQKPSTSLKNGVVSTYCSQTCAEEGRLRRGTSGSTHIREQLFCLEQGKCQICGIDANALFLRIKSLQPPERLNSLCNANWKLPKTRAALERLLQSPKEGDFWQADHIVPVAEGGGSCGLENLRTLCTPCHQGETQKLTFRLRLNDRFTSSATASAGECSGKRNIDLVTFFSTSKNTKSTSTKKRKYCPD